MLTPQQREIVNRFQVAASLIHTGPDGLPSDPDQAQELMIMAKQAQQIVGFCSKDAAAADEAAVWRLANVWRAVMATCIDRSRDPDVGRAWLAARAGLPRFG